GVRACASAVGRASIAAAPTAAPAANASRLVIGMWFSSSFALTTSAGSGRAAVRLDARANNDSTARDRRATRAADGLRPRVQEREIDLVADADDVAVAEDPPHDALAVHADAVLAADVLDDRRDPLPADARVDAAHVVAADADIARD